jgi:hypothetical protein
MKMPMNEAIYSDCETDLERSLFFACGRAYATGIVADAVSKDIARAFFQCSAYEYADKRPPEVPLNYGCGLS